MKQLVAAAALGAVLVFTVGCGPASPTKTSPPTTPPTTPSR